MGLFGSEVGALNADDLDLGQALAHVASVVLVADQRAAAQAEVNERLQNALSSRVLVEQAKGVLSQVGKLEMDDAFVVLRHYARDHNLRLGDLAGVVVRRALPAQLLLGHVAARYR